MVNPKICKSVHSDQRLPSASSWTYLTNREKSDMFYHYTNTPVKDHLTDLVASILDKIFRTQTTKRLKMSIYFETM